QNVLTQGTYSFTAPHLADGIHRVRARLTTQQGEPTTESLSVTIVTEPPHASSLSAGANHLAIYFGTQDVIINPDSVTNRSHFTLLASGFDSTFDDGNEINRSEAITNITFDPFTFSAHLDL